MDITPVVVDSTEFVSQRIARTGTLILQGDVLSVFPLFGPIREKDWAYGWDPEILFSGAGDVEEHMMFRTPSAFRDDEYYLWTIVKYWPEEFTIEYMISAPNRIWFVLVACEGHAKGTKASVTYTYTGLSEQGNQENRSALNKMFSSDLKDWEEAINFYLKNGQCLIP